MLNSTVSAWHKDWFKILNKLSYLESTFFFQVPGGMLAERKGGKRPFGIGILLASIFTLLSPFAARVGGRTAFAAIRAAEGLAEGEVTFLYYKNRILYF